MIATSFPSGSNAGAVSPSTKSNPPAGSTTGLNPAGESGTNKKSFQNVLSQIVAQEQMDSANVKGNAAVLTTRAANRKEDPSNDQAQTTPTDGPSTNLLTVPVNNQLTQVQPIPLPPSSTAKQGVLASTIQGSKNSAATALGLGNLQGSAFAMRITSAKSNNSTVKEQAADQSPSNGSDSTDPASTSGGLATAQTGHTQTFAEVAAAAGVLSTAHQSAWSSSDLATVSSTPRVTANSQTAMTDAAQTISDDSVDSPTQVRSLQVQVSGESGARVDLRFVEHSGGLSLSVRSSDNTLTRGLQDSLPELTTRLAEEKYQTHVFLPAGSETPNGWPSTAVSSSSNSSGSSQQQQSGGGSFTQQDGSGSGGNSGREQNGQPDETAAWWRQLAALGKLSSSASSTSSTTENPPANS